MTMEIITEAPFRTAKRQRRITGGKLTGQKPALKMKGGLVDPRAIRAEEAGA